jgi:hypothetical protein
MVEITFPPRFFLGSKTNTAGWLLRGNQLCLKNTWETPDRIIGTNIFIGEKSHISDIYS